MLEDKIATKGKPGDLSRRPRTSQTWESSLFSNEEPVGVSSGDVPGSQCTSPTWTSSVFGSSKNMTSLETTSTEASDNDFTTGAVIRHKSSISFDTDESPCVELPTGGKKTFIEKPSSAHLKVGEWLPSNENAQDKLPANKKHFEQCQQSSAQMDTLLSCYSTDKPMEEYKFSRKQVTARTTRTPIDSFSGKRMYYSASNNQHHSDNLTGETTDLPERINGKKLYSNLNSNDSIEVKNTIFQ